MNRILALGAVLLAVGFTVHAQTYTPLYDFSNPGDPSYPGVEFGALQQTLGGYIVTTAGDFVTADGGSAFKMSTTGDISVLQHFPGPNGKFPTGSLTVATDGNFYGTNNYGGQFNYGNIFRLSSSGKLTILHSFTGGADGGSPESAPIESEGGDLYGTTTGGTGCRGTVYRITKSGQFKTLHCFAGQEGVRPSAPLIQGTDLYFYGTTYRGGPHGLGSVYRINSNGDFKIMFGFNNTNGAHPYAGLVQGNDGNFYGVTTQGGTMGGGVVFKMTPGRVVTVLHNFTGGNDGSNPIATLIEGIDGNFYGTTADTGVLFNITPSGNFMTLHSLNLVSTCALLQHTNGLLYGVTEIGGRRNAGIFYSFNMGLAPFVTYLRVYGRVGTTVQILGQGFTSGSVARFNGRAAQTTVVNSKYLRAVVPAGATTGYITVTTGNVSLKSNKVFIVRP
jgi:uncharacterized repeat protein (TIGR03803 family)